MNETSLTPPSPGEPALSLSAAAGPAWIGRAPGAPYFVTDAGEPWTPIGQNDAITWPELAGLFRRRDLEGVERHLRGMRDSGVTVLRLMLEYVHHEHRYLERPAGRFVPAMVRLWDDLIGLCARLGLRVLLTPFDTFFTWARWRHHPYNTANGGPCPSRRRLLTHPATRQAIKARFAFATERWGGSGTIFAWDLWNEMHPAQAEERPEAFDEFIRDVGPFLRDLETRLHGRAHLQCVSVFGPELYARPWIAEPIFRHPLLDFASSHFYETGTIDDPRDTVAPALAAARLTREAIDHIQDDRPFLDSEHGPIHRFKDKHRNLPEPFDDEYFRHIQWAHLASGGAGGGMRWPNRHPHMLTPGMRAAQKALAGFLPLVDWPRFRRRNLHGGIEADGGLHVMGCGDEAQAVLWLLRPNLRETSPGLRQVEDGAGPPVTLRVPGLAPGPYRVLPWDTRAGRALEPVVAAAEGEGLRVTLPMPGADLALAIRRGT